MLTLLVTLDCVRADHIETKSGLAPRLGALRPEFTDFTEAFAQSQNTLSSHVSMLTSNYLFQHGVYSNFTSLDLPAHAINRRLAAAGWECAAFTSIEFLSLLLGNQVGRPDPAFPPYGNRGIVQRVVRRVLGNRRGAGGTISAGLNWLGKLPREKNAFLWLHLFDAHMVYSAPGAYLDHFAPKKSAAQTVSKAIAERGWFSPHFEEYEWKVALEHFPGRYKAAVAFIDEWLGKFFAELKARRIWNDALIFITADHGECLLGDHGIYCAHKKLFDTTVKVPMLVKFPGGRNAGKSVGGIVQHLDIAPTIAAFAGVESSSYAGLNMDSIASGESPGHPFAFSEHVDNFMRAARDGDFIFTEVVPGAENKWKMPLESGDFFTRAGVPEGGERGRREELKAGMERLMREGSAVRTLWSKGADPEEEVASRLRSLGYM